VDERMMFRRRLGMMHRWMFQRVGMVKLRKDDKEGNGN